MNINDYMENLTDATLKYALYRVGVAFIINLIVVGIASKIVVILLDKGWTFLAFTIIIIFIFPFMLVGILATYPYISFLVNFVNFYIEDLVKFYFGSH